jgi:hypothetical protein
MRNAPKKGERRGFSVVAATGFQRKDVKTPRKRQETLAILGVFAPLR